MNRTLLSLPGSMLGEMRSRLVWGIRSRIGKPLAILHRKRLGGVTFIGITGSSGKTTAKLMTTAILATEGQVREWKGTANSLHHIQSIIRGTRPSDDYCVVEFSADTGPGGLDEPLDLVKPHIGAVTTIGTEHIKSYHSDEAIAAEKGKLIKALPSDGIAVLNADDPLVLAMGDGFAGHIITFGTAADANLRAENINAAWPDRLSFTALYEGQSCHVQTQLCGSHWVTVVLSALAAGIAAGIPLEAAARAVGTVEPFMARMEPVETPNGVTFIRDDWKAPLWAMPTAFNFLAEAKAPRKIAILGTISHYSGSSKATYVKVAKEALKSADFVFFVGPMAVNALDAKRDKDDRSLRIFSDTKSASDYLDHFLQPGDLVLIKGSARIEHLARLYHNQVSPISCWQMECGRRMLCDACPLLHSDIGKAGRPSGHTQAASKPAPALPQLEAPFNVIVGFGNPGGQYVNSPHNLGFQVLDILADRLGLAWVEQGDAALAHGPADGRQLLLVKPLKNVNNAGKCLLPLSETMGFTPDDVILVQDDNDLPLGKLRTRMKGSDGGHKGVLSLIMTYQTNEFRRIKVGVKQDGTGNPSEYLTSPLPASLRPSIDAASEEAADRVLALVSTP